MKKTILLAIAAASAAVLVLPIMASAGTWHAEPISKFSGASGTSELTTTTGARVHCATVVFNGSYESTTGGKLNLLFHGCKGPMGVTCQSASQPAETILTTPLYFHNVQLEPGNTNPGVLVTPNSIDSIPGIGEGHFATFTCMGVTTIVRGNGVLGELTFPECGKTTSTATLSFARASQGNQKWTQVTTSGTSYDLTAKVGAEAYKTASFDGSGTVLFEKDVTINCTHP